MNADKERPTMLATHSYFLTEHSYCCEFHDGAIILALDTGTYIGINAEDLPVLQRHVRNWPRTDNSNSLEMEYDSDNHPILATLVSRNVLTTSPVLTQSIDVKPARATANSSDCRRPVALSPSNLLSFLVSLLGATFYHRDKFLNDHLKNFSKKQRELSPQRLNDSLDDAYDTLSIFLRLRLWFYTADRRCLFDSLVLAEFLTRRMIACTFVIGVSTKPFFAHAWVQIGDVVLNDTTEHVQAFSPIFAAGDSAVRS